MGAAERVRTARARPVGQHRRRWGALAFALVLAVAVGAAAYVRGADTDHGRSMLAVIPVQPFDDQGLSVDQLQRAWAAAPPLNLALAPSAGSPALAIQLRAVYSATTVYFWLHWPDYPGGAPLATDRRQRATLTWRRGSAIGSCAVVCHTSFSTGQRIDDLQVVALDVDDHSLHLVLGDWQNGWWTMGYSRPLVTGDPMDVQFADLRRAYLFGIDVAMGAASAHSNGESLLLRFAPAGT